MQNEIQTVEPKMYIMKKNGHVHKVSADTGKKLSDQLITQSGHTFLRLKELNGIILNTAEIEGVYDEQQYADVCRMNAGDWRCPHDTWHTKKEKCNCQKEIYRKMEEKRRSEIYDSVTDEERAKAQEHIRKAEEIGALNGSDMFRAMFQKGSDKKIRKTTIREWEKDNGVKANINNLNIE